MFHFFKFAFCAFSEEAKALDGEQALEPSQLQAGDHVHTNGTIRTHDLEEGNGFLSLISFLGLQLAELKRSSIGKNCNLMNVKIYVKNI